MKNASFLLFACTVIGAQVALANQNDTFPPRSGDGYINIHNTREYTYDVYPKEYIWTEHGRPYWRATGTTAAVTAPAPVKTEVAPVAKTIVAQEDSVSTGQSASRPASSMGPVALHYENNQYSLSEESRRELESLRKMSKAELAQVKKIKVSGYASNLGTAGYNQRLSEKRALTVKQEMVKLGIKSDKIEARGFGIEEGADADHARRVDVVIE